MASVWKGAISFGLVNIPVRLNHASRDKELKFHLLHKKDLSEIRYARICKSEGKEVPWSEIVKGYELDEGKYIVLTDVDFKNANPKKTRTIEILSFTNEAEIDPLYCQMPYFIEPEKGAAKAYTLLRDALAKSKKVAVGSFIFRNREHIGMIVPYGHMLMLIQLRYQSELVNHKDFEIPPAPIPKKELDMAIQFIDQMTEKFNPKEYKDTYTEELKQMIKKKSKGKKVSVKKGKEGPSPKVHDIMSLLKESLAKSPKKRRKIA